MLNLKAFDSDTLDKWLKRSAKTKYRKLKLIFERFSKNLIRQSEISDFTFDIDAMSIEANKSTAEKTYKGFRGYLPLLGFLKELPINVFEKFQTGNTSPAAGICDAVEHVVNLMPKNKRLAYLRSDSAGYQAKVINFCDGKNITYTITADFDSSVKAAIAGIPDQDWQPRFDSQGKVTDREYAQTIHTMNKSHNAFRLIVQRHQSQQLKFLFAV